MLLNKNKETCIFINSCDNTYDITKYFLKSYDKYIKNNELDIFIGINKKKHNKSYKYLNYISTPKSNWRNETLFQLNIIKKKYGYKNVIHILDDFIFSGHSNIDDLQSTLSFFKSNKIKYCCLKNMREGGFLNIFNKFKKEKINTVRHSYPYYTSLQITLWDIKYFIKNIKSCTSIWNFERQQLSKNHYHLKKDFFHYRHVVEKGEWDYGSSDYICKYVCKFSPGKRPMRKSFFGSQIFYIKKITFFIFGFLIMRIRNN